MSLRFRAPSFSPDAHRSRAITMVAGLLSIAAIAAGVTNLHPGDPAPPLVMTSMQGDSVRVPDADDRVTLLLFGDSSHKSVLNAATHLGTVLVAPGLRDVEVSWVTVLTEDSDAGAVLAGIDENAMKVPTMVLDRGRAAFDAYKVIALPAIAVIDPKGSVVYTHAGPLAEGETEVLRSLLVAAGKIERGEEEQAPVSGDVTAAEQRAARMTRLAEELARRGMDEAAEQSFTRSLALAPDDERTLVGLGELLTRMGRPGEAEPLFRRALEVNPDSRRATLGVIHALINQGDSHLGEAETSLRGVLKNDPGNAQAHYLMGLVYERRDEIGEAAQSFKRAAEILLGSEVGSGEK